MQSHWKWLVVHSLLITATFAIPPALGGIALTDTEAYITGIGESVNPKKPAPDYLELPSSWDEGFRLAARLTERDQREYAACLMLSEALRFEMTPLLKGNKLSVESGTTLEQCDGLVIGTIHTHSKFADARTSFYFPVPSDKDFAHFLINDHPAAVVVSGNGICVMVKGHARFQETATHQVGYGVRVFQAHLDPSIKSPAGSYVALAQEAATRGTNLYCGVIGARLNRVLPKTLKQVEGPFILAAKGYLIARARSPGHELPMPTFSFTPERDKAVLDYLKKNLQIDARTGQLKASSEKLYEAVLLSRPDDVEAIGFGPIGFAYPDERLNPNTIQLGCDSKANGEEYQCSLYEVRKEGQPPGDNALIAQYASESKTSVSIEQLGRNQYRATLTTDKGSTVLIGPWTYRNEKWALNGQGKYITADWTIEGTYTDGDLLGPCVLTKPNGEVYRMVFNADGSTKVTERVK
jgi:hypothetical protein